MKAVYSYLFPEVRGLVRCMEQVDPRVYLNTTTADDAARMLSPVGLEPPLDVPATPDGNVDMDEIHVPVMERLVAALVPHAPGLDGFPHVYPLSGSSPGIFHLLSEAAGRGEHTVHVLAGEYEGFGHYAHACGMNVKEIAPDEFDDYVRLGYARTGTWFVSNPSARDGGRADDEIQALLDSGAQVVVDLAYLGTDNGTPIDVSHPGVVAVVASLSKPYGMFRFRVGFLASREPVESLYASKWFKDADRLITGLRVVEAHPPGALAARYRRYQREAVRRMSDETGVPFEASPVLLLATLDGSAYETLDGEQKALVGPYRRGSTFRLCLTPYFEELEREGF